MLLLRAQRPLATASLVVRDEEAAGSNPVTPPSFISGHSRRSAALPPRGGAFALPRTATVLIAGTPPTFAALRWSASSWRSHRSPSSLPRLHGEDLRQALHAGCADDGVLRRVFLAVGVAVVGVVDDQTAVGFDVGDDASRRPTRERLPTPRIPNRWPVCSARGKRAGLCACSSTALGFGECD